MEMKKIITLVLFSAALCSCSDNDPETILTYTMTFENIPALYRAADAYGSNCYSSYSGGSQFTSYTDPATGLTWGVNRSSYDGSYDLWNGGIVVSNFNDRQTTTYFNQCSIDWGTHNENSKAGCNGSDYFAVITGFEGPWGDNRTYIYFSDETMKAEFRSMYMCNTAYASYVMEYGGLSASPLTSGGWLKVVITGYDGDAATGSIDYYLADFRTGSSPGIIKGWKKVDLSSLGKINKLVFDVKGSDTSLDNGLNTPAYFCIDDLVYIKETLN